MGEVCGCSVTAFFDAHVRAGGEPIRFDQWLRALGLRAVVTWGPALAQDGKQFPDLRLRAWTPPGQPEPSLRGLYPLPPEVLGGLRAIYWAPRARVISSWAFWRAARCKTS